MQAVYLPVCMYANFFVGMVREVAAAISWLWLALKSRLVCVAGNGIESILYDRPDIMYISLHRYGDTLLCVTLWTDSQSCSLRTIRAVCFVPIVWLCSSSECQHLSAGHLQ